MILTAAGNAKNWLDSIDKNNNFANVPRNWLGYIDRNHIPLKNMKTVKKQMIVIVILIFSCLILYIVDLLLK
jgi:hypothetical protein